MANVNYLVYYLVLYLVLLLFRHATRSFQAIRKRPPILLYGKEERQRERDRESENDNYVDSYVHNIHIYTHTHTFISTNIYPCKQHINYYD